MHEYAVFLGREAALSMAELEAIFARSEHRLRSVSRERAIVTGPEFRPDFIAHLGGIIKIASVEAESTQASNPVAAAANLLTPDWIVRQLPTGRIEFGLSLYGMRASQERQIQRQAMRLKKELVAAGRQVRVVVSREPQLSAVTVVRQGLLKHGKEFILDWQAGVLRLAITQAVQDYQAYTIRDRGRPAADPRSGMLPVKVAQMMLNIAQVTSEDVLLDPFCGSGTIVQEAVLLGVREVHGSDVETRAVKDSQTNLRWLFKEFPSVHANVEITKRDARQASIRPTVIVTEPYLGKPLRGNESESFLGRQIRDLEKLYAESFATWATSLPSGGRVVMVWPEFMLAGQPRSLALEEKISQLGFQAEALLAETTAQALNHDQRLMVSYGRPDAKLRRQIRKWTKL